MPNTLSILACAPSFGAPGDVKTNTLAILKRLDQAREQEAGILLMPEYCLSGDCGSLARQPVFLEACQAAAQEIARHTKGLLCVFGLPLFHEGATISALALCYRGEILGYCLKGLKGQEEIATVRKEGQEIPRAGRLVLTLGGDAQNIRVQVGFFSDFTENAPDWADSQAQIVLLANRQAARAGVNLASLVSALPEATRIPCLAISNAGANESTTDQVFPGYAVILHHGHLAAQATGFSGSYALANALPQIGDSHPPVIREKAKMDPRRPYAPFKPQALAAWCRDCLEIPAQGLATRMARIHSQSATLGVSGGLDSAMALLITRRTFDLLGLPREKIYAYSLPGLGTSQRTRNNAWRLMEAVGLKPREIDLGPSIRMHFKDIGQDPNTHDAAYENAQARERTQVLMDLANRLDGLMVGSGDLSELALGFTTFGGDHMSMYGVNAGLYKTSIRLALRQCALDTDSPLLKATLTDILDTPISPELVPGEGGSIAQKTEDILGPYELNDFFLHHFLLHQAPPGQMLEQALVAFGQEYKRTELLQRMRSFFLRFFRNQFKRNCLPEGPEVLGVSLSPRGAWEMPSDAAAQVWLTEIDALMKG